jgi:hypothetical protein
VLAFTDCAPLKSYIEKGGGKSVAANKIIHLIWDFCVANETALQIRWISGDTMVSIGVDELSRRVPSVRYQIRLNPNLFAVINARHGPFHVDRMASRADAQLPHWVMLSLTTGPGSHPASSTSVSCITGASLTRTLCSRCCVICSATQQR